MRTIEQIDYPQTVDEWWLFLEANKEDLRNLVTAFHPYYKCSYSLPITARLAEEVCKVIREEIVEQTDEDPLKLFDVYLETRDVAMATLLNEIWFGMPESVGVRSENGFGKLCDLCSESYVLEEEDNADQT